MSYPAGAQGQPPPPPPPPPPAAYPPPSPPPPGWSPSPAARAQGPGLPKWLDIGLIVIGVGTLLIFIGFICGFLAATQFPTSSSAGSLSNYDGDLQAFFLLTGFGILLTVGGWLFRVVMVARRGRP